MATQLEIVNMSLMLIGEDVITQTQLDNESTKPALLCNRFYEQTLDEVLRDNAPACSVDRIELFETTGAITNITKADPGVVTSTAHGLSDGQRIRIYDVVGMTEVNGVFYTVSNPTADTFELRDSTDDNDVDTSGSGYTAYDSGGNWAKSPKYEWSYEYVLPTSPFVLRVLKLNEGEVQDKYVVEGRRLRTNADKANAVIVKRVTTTADLDSLTVWAMSILLASKIVYSLQLDDGKRLNLLRQYLEFNRGTSAYVDSTESDISDRTSGTYQFTWEDERSY